MLHHVHCMLIALVVVPSMLAAAELMPGEMPIEQVIDHYVQQQLGIRGIQSAPQCDESTLVRRTTLDLAGRIPTQVEAQAFAASPESDKRVKLVDRLMASPDFAYHFRNGLEGILSNGQRNSPGEWREYLLKAVRQNRHWDQLFREMMTGNEEDPEVKPALTFLRVRARDLDQLTNDVSTLFFGVNVSCAKCHDHPLVDDWKQDHYFGMSSFFNRIYLTKSNLIAEKFSGDVKFKTTKGEEKLAKIMFLTSAIIEAPVVEKTPEQTKAENDAVSLQTKDEKAGPPPKPDFSPRAKLVEIALQNEHNLFFARNAVNRIWALLVGRGLVHPLDQMHSANPASHPELLVWLTRDLIAHQYDLQRLVRGIICSQTYSRSSIWGSAGDPPSPDLFALAQVRPLSTRQYSLSLRIASFNPETMTNTTSPEWVNRRDELERQADDLANQFEVPGESFQIGVDEALLFNNNSRLWDEYVRDDGSTLIGYLKQKPDRMAQIETAFWTVLSRPPMPDERSHCESFLIQKEANPLLGLRQMVWSLLASPELRFNH
jgi:hypothetical protein